MPTIFEPIGAGLIVALISKFIINNDKLCKCTANSEEPEIIEDDSSSNTTSVNGAEIHIHHMTPWMHT